MLDPRLRKSVCFRSGDVGVLFPRMWEQPRMALAGYRQGPCEERASPLRYGFPSPASLSCGETDVRGLGDPGAPVFLALVEGGG